MTELKKTPVGKAAVNQTKANAKANSAKGHALATVCVAYATKIAEEDGKRSEKLKTIVKSIGELTHEGHIEFRSQLKAELDLIRELEKGAGAEGRMQGYSMNSFKVMVSNWTSISQACELGLTTKTAEGEAKPWGQVLGEAVELKHAHAANSQNPSMPTKRKEGRRTLTDLDRAKAAADKLSGADLVKFATYVQTKLTLAKASNKAPSAAPAKADEPALV